MHYIERRIKEGEHQTQDFKFRVDDAKKIAKTLVAFANTDGGRLLIGVKDNGRIAGVRSDEEFYVIEAASQMYTTPEVPFKAIIHDIDGKQVLEVEVEPSETKPHFAIDSEGRQIAYFRKDDQNHPANGVLLELWRMSSDGSKSTVLELFRDEHRVLYTMIENGERVTLSKFARNADIPPGKARTILASFLKWKVLDFDIDQRGIFFTSTETKL